MVKEILFEDLDDVNGFGLFAVSVTEAPAIKENWTMLSEHDKVKLSIQDEENRIVFAPVLIPGMKIYRNVNGEEFELTVTDKTIQRIAVDFFEKKRTTNVNVEHQNELVEGFVFFQSVFTNDLIPTIKGYEHLPVGTWFLGSKVKDDAKWSDIKDGKYVGWSIHGRFKQEEVNLSDAKKILNLILKNI